MGERCGTACWLAGAPLDWERVSGRRASAEHARALPLLISGRDDAAMRAQAQRWSTYLEAHAELAWPDVVCTAAAHRKHLQQHLRAAQFRPRLIPINLAFLSELVALRHAGHTRRPSQLRFSLAHVLPNRNFGDLVLGVIRPEADAGGCGGGVARFA